MTNGQWTIKNGQRIMDNEKWKFENRKLKIENCCPSENTGANRVTVWE